MDSRLKHLSSFPQNSMRVIDRPAAAPVVMSVSSETLRSAIPSAQGRIRQHRLAEVLQIVIIMCAVEKNTTNLVTIRD
jgi:hypothetical protein